MSQSGRRLFRIFGINIEFDYSWFIILFLFSLWLGDYFRAQPGWTPAQVWTAAVVTTLLFFASVVVHELSHSLMARARGISVHSIRLFVFGGVSQIESEPRQAWEEFAISIVGPLTSLILGALLVLAARTQTPHSLPWAVTYWLGWINIVLGLFNLIPGFPLDGGRVLRAALWSLSHNFDKATRWAANVGKGIAILFILYGIAQVLRGGDLGGIWMVLIGWFLLSAADQSLRQVKIQNALADYTVRDIASPFYNRLAAGENLEDYFNQISGQHEYRPSLVMDDDQLLGVIAPSDLRRTPREQWNSTPVRQAMTPRDQLTTAGPRESLHEVLKKIVAANLSQIPILQDGKVQGVIRRDRILQLLHDHLTPQP